MMAIRPIHDRVSMAERPPTMAALTDRWAALVSELGVTTDEAERARLVADVAEVERAAADLIESGAER